MKKKHLNILLITLVISIWGKLIYNYTKRFAKPPVTIVNHDNRYLDIIKVEKKAFNLTKLNRDPFLNIITTKKKIIKKKKEKTKIVPISKNTTWPTISYLGFIKNKSTANKLAILKVNGSVKNIKESTYFNENIYISKIYKDSIILQLNNQSKTIKK